MPCSRYDHTLIPGPDLRYESLEQEIIRVMKPGAALEVNEIPSFICTPAFPDILSQMLEEDLYIPGQLLETADSDSPLSAISSSGSSEELSPTWTSLVPGPVPSLLGISTESSHSSSQLSRSPISERPHRRQSTSPTTSRPPLSTRSKSRSIPSSPENVRPFPMLKPRKSATRPIASHFRLHNLLPKRPGRDDGARTDGERNRKQRSVPVPSNAGLNSLSTPGVPTTPNQNYSANKPTSSGEGLPLPNPYSNTGGATPNLALGSLADTNATPVPAQALHKLGERRPPLTLTLPESTDGQLEVDFPQRGRNDSPKRTRTRSFSCPTPEDDGQWRSTASREFRPSLPNVVGTHDHLHRARSSNARSSGNPSALTNVESTEWNRQYGGLTVIPPLPPPKDIPGKQKPRPIPSISPSVVSDSAAGLSRSVPDRFIDHLDGNGDQFLSPTRGSAKPIRSLSTSSLAVSTSRSTGEAPPSQRNDLSSDNSGVDNSISSPTAEIPPNPRQHKVLEVIYTEMHAIRFVNLAPLSLLENYIRTYFKSTCLFPRFWVDLLLTSLLSKTSVPMRPSSSPFHLPRVVNTAPSLMRPDFNKGS